MPFPGDWHLKKFQPVFMEVFFDAGLKQLAETSGYRGETLTSLGTCSNFKRTNSFLLQLHEALLRQLISTFTKAATEVETTSMLAVLNEVVRIFQQCTKESNTTISKSLQQIYHLISSEPVRQLYQQFLLFMQSRCSADHLWLFWVRFTMVDCMAYIALFLAIRSRNWTLQMIGIKLKGPLFSVFDRPTYRRLVPHHLHTLSQMPTEMTETLAGGSFAVALSERRWHSVALDEAHETKINKACKTAIVRPTGTNMHKLSAFLASYTNCKPTWCKSSFQKGGEQILIKSHHLHPKSA